MAIFMTDVKNGHTMYFVIMKINILQSKGYKYIVLKMLVNQCILKGIFSAFNKMYCLAWNRKENPQYSDTFFKPTKFNQFQRQSEIWPNLQWRMRGGFF